MAVGLLAGACTVGPDYRRPAILAETRSAPPLVEGTSTAFTSEPLPDRWWQMYDVPALDALITKALIRNADLRKALATLEATQSAMRAIELERTPQSTFTGSATYGQGSADAAGATKALKPRPVYAFAEAISYDLDLFGRLRRNVESGRAEVDVARAALDLTRINVAAQVARAYSAVCATGNQIAVNDRSIELARDIVSVSDRRFRGGISGINDVVRARALLAQTEADRPTYVARQRAALYLLATLTGDPPEQVPIAVSGCASPAVVRRPIPTGDGAALLRRRPDIRQAERRLAGEVAAIGVTTAALYPSITLGGDLGTVATRAGDILRDRAFSGKLGPLVSWSFPNVAVARAEVAQANALARADLAAFDGTVLAALRETETSMSALTRQIENERSLMEARDQAAIAARNTKRLYAGGIGEFIDTLDAERTLIQADAMLADATAQLADRQVDLFLALGGGWQDAPQPLETPLDDVVVTRRRGPDPSRNGTRRNSPDQRRGGD
ncbi:efflux transporter outer membrane subunit [Sphingomonas morindae]|uniref:Efflux transporter outer membrane subunit n=1 Tax=Sphingomonas morindae TaxID=1541170 RepID=A0ABY4XAJ3_9SPHN|nr:efflux transporter outer membrane subunit [Sphingomonas morindae]USI73893.1 efflux transporter outer membrane subunit [Sphingomonas morindae]